MKTRLSYALALTAGILLSLASCSKTASVSVDNSTILAKPRSGDLNRQSIDKSSVSDQSTQARVSEDKIAEDRTMKAAKPEKMHAPETKDVKSSVKEDNTRKMSVTEKIVTRKIEKLNKKMSLKERLKTQQLDQNLKIGLILILIGLIIGVVFGYLGYILVLVGLIFILIWAINNL